MDEETAQSWLVSEFDVSRETMDRLDCFVALLRRENDRQNLISKATLDHIWARHIVDSAQLLRFAPAHVETWLDLGTGAGFPGIVIALLHPAFVTMVEERRMRADFLNEAVEALGIGHECKVVHSRAERLDPIFFDVITARAFAPLPKLLEIGERFSGENTRWILPKGRNARSELEAIAASWQGRFELEPSITNDDAFIIVCEQVRRRGKGKERI